MSKVGIVLVVLALAGASAWSDSNDVVCGARPQYASSCKHTITKGDDLTTLALVAEEYQVEESTLLGLNPDIENPDALGVGQVVVLPCAAETSGKSALDLLCNRIEQNQFLKALVALNMTDMLADPSANLTVFAPRNSAVRALLGGLTPPLTLEQALQENEAMIREIVAYHIVPGVTITSTDLEVDGLLLPTLLGQELMVTLKKPRATPHLETSTGQTVKIIKRGLAAGSAVVHVVNTVLLPEESFA